MMVGYRTLEEYNNLMMEAQFEFLHWLDDNRMNKRAEKLKFAKVRKATLAARRKVAREG